jgi:uncharacterized protein GlcG (DUF336 family)
MSATINRVALVIFACVTAFPASAQLIQRKDLSYGIAKTIAENALEDCKARGYAVSVVVVDRAGLNVVALRADGASPHTMENARRKAYTAMTFKMTTEEFIGDMATRRSGASRPRCPMISSAVCRQGRQRRDRGIGPPARPRRRARVMAGINKVKDQLQERG